MPRMKASHTVPSRTSLGRRYPPLDVGTKVTCVDTSLPWRVVVSDRPRLRTARRAPQAVRPPAADCLQLDQIQPTLAGLVLADVGLGAAELLRQVHALAFTT